MKYPTGSTSLVISPMPPPALSPIPVEQCTIDLEACVLTRAGAADKPGSGYFENVTWNDPRIIKIYERGKVYLVGPEREFPLPSYVKQRWDEIIKVISEYLAKATGQMSQSIPSERKIVEPDLCMAGQTTPILFGRTKIALKPTVWIRCGGSRCVPSRTTYAYGVAMLF
jgi:hypothetical protein